MPVVEHAKVSVGLMPHESRLKERAKPLERGGLAIAPTVRRLGAGAVSWCGSHEGKKRALCGLNLCGTYQPAKSSEHPFARLRGLSQLLWSGPSSLEQPPPGGLSMRWLATLRGPGIDVLSTRERAS